MVESQIVRRGVNDPLVLEAFRTVPRHRYVPDSMQMQAYADHPLPIGAGQTISQPYMVALMTECLRLKGGERVLEVGTGSGYQAAVLANIASEVYTIEKEEDLLVPAMELLAKEGYDNVFFKRGDGTLGWEEKAPFEGIIVTAGAPEVPPSLKRQLADGGRLVIPVGSLYSQMLVTVRREGNNFTSENVCGCVFVPLIGREGWREEEYA